MEDNEYSYGNSLEELVKDVKQYLITDAHSWQTAIAGDREDDATGLSAYDIWFALILRDLRFDLSTDDFNGFLEVTDQGILDEMHHLDDTYRIDNRTRYEDFSEVAMGVVIPGRFLCIECVKEILGRDLTPGDFCADTITMRSGGIITQLFHNEEELTAEEATQLSELKERYSQENADREIQEGRRNCPKHILDKAWNPCNKCGRRVWEDLGVSTDSTTGYSLRNELWNYIWERWEQIRDDEGE